MVRFNDKPQIQDNALSDTDIMPITDIEDSLSDKKISIGQLKKYLSKNLTNFADIDLVNTDMLADAIIEAPNGIIVANNSNNAIIAKKGLKLLFANGRKQNGKFNNLEYTLQKDVSQAVLSLPNGNYVIFLSYTGSIGYIPIEEIYISSEQPQASTTNAYWYDIISNYWKYTSTSGATWANTTINILGQVTIANNLLTTVTPNTLAYIPIPETLTIRDLSNITNSGEKRIKDLVQPNIDLAINNTSNTINAKINSVNSNLQAQVSQNRADINTLNAGEIIAEDIAKLRSTNELRRSKFAIENDLDVYNILEKEKHSTFDKSKFTVIGTPAISDAGVATFTTSGQYLTFNRPVDMLTKPWCIKGFVNSLNQFAYNAIVKLDTSSYRNRISFASDLSFVSFSLYDGTSTYASNRLNLDFNNHSFSYEWGFDGIETYTLKIKRDIDTDWQIISMTLSNPIVTSGDVMCISAPVEGVNGSIDLSKFSITVDVKEVFSGNKTGIDVIKEDNYTVVGSPVISADGVASGFSASNYVKTNFQIGELANKSWSVEGTIYLSENIEDYRGNVPAVKLSTGWFSQGSVTFNMYNGACNFQMRTGTSEEYSPEGVKISLRGVYTTEGWYKYKAEYNHSTGTYTLSAGRLGQEYSHTGSWAATTSNTQFIYINTTPTANMVFGVGSDGIYTDTSIDLNAFKIYVDGNLVYQPTLRIPYTQSKTDEKIVNAVYRDRVQDMYEQFGYTHYYTLGDEPTIPNAYTLQTVSNETIVDMYESEDGTWEQRADLTLRQRGISCTSGTPVTLLKEFRDDKYSLSIGYSSKSASSFTPSASGDWFAEGKVYLQ